MLFGHQHRNQLLAPHHQFLQRLGLGVGRWTYLGPFPFRIQRQYSASLRSVLALSPRPLAKFRTHDGVTAATAIPAVHSAATTWRCSPPVASTTTSCGFSSPSRPTKRLIPARSLVSVMRSPPGRAATTSSALLT